MTPTPIRACLTSALLFVPLLAAQAADGPAPPAGSPGIHVDHYSLEAALQSATAAGKDPAVAPVVITDQYLINQVHRTKPTAPPAIHPGWTELHWVLEGSATFVTGGRIIAGDGSGKSVVEGGIARRITKGDAIVVPANTPHWYSQIEGSGITVLEVRFLAPPAANAPK